MTTFDNIVILFEKDNKLFVSNEDYNFVLPMVHKNGGATYDELEEIAKKELLCIPNLEFRCRKDVYILKDKADESSFFGYGGSKDMVMLTFSVDGELTDKFKDFEWDWYTKSEVAYILRNSIFEEVSENLTFEMKCKATMDKAVYYALQKWVYGSIQVEKG